MADAWGRGTRDESTRSPLQGGAPSTHGGADRGPDEDRGERRDRHVRLGVSHPSDDPTRHRVFEIRAAYDDAAGGWVARVGEQNLNEQLDGWGPRLTDGGRPRAFSTAAECLGDAVAAIVAMVDREADEPS